MKIGLICESHAHWLFCILPWDEQIQTPSLDTSITLPGFKTPELRKKQIFFLFFTHYSVLSIDESEQSQCVEGMRSQNTESNDVKTVLLLALNLGTFNTWSVSSSNCLWVCDMGVHMTSWQGPEMEEGCEIRKREGWRVGGLGKVREKNKKPELNEHILRQAIKEQTSVPWDSGLTMRHLTDFIVSSKTDLSLTFRRFLGTCSSWWITLPSLDSGEGTQSCFNLMSTTVLLIQRKG